MTEKREDGRPSEGDLVRMVGGPDGRIMWVTCASAGQDHDWEGVRNGIHREWVVNGETTFEVFRPCPLVTIKPAADSGETST